MRCSAYGTFVLLSFIQISIFGSRLKPTEESEKTLLTSNGKLKDPMEVCSSSAVSSRETCSLHQRIPVHLAATIPIKDDPESSTRPECAPADVDCEPTCPSCNHCAKYRSLDGTCNNLDIVGDSWNCKRLWGSINSPLRRSASNNYADGQSEPTTGLPNPRTLSNALFNMIPTPTDNRFSMMLMQFGQFLDHDISLTPEVSLDLGRQNCCDDPSLSPECLPIEIPLPDPWLTEHCMEFVRSAPHCSSPLIREQFNAITAFIDGSMIYGDPSLQLQLRQYTDGLMKVETKDDEDYLPIVDPCPVAYGGSPFGQQFLAGDRRVTENPGLTSLHTIFVREHNRVATEIKSLFSWNDEKIYQEARRIVVAELQNIVYNEFLPIVLGSDTVPHGLNSAYDDNEDASVHNVFATAAYRFGHSLITQMLNMPSSGDTYDLEENFFDINEIWNNEKLDEILKGATNQESEESDQFINNAVRNNLFKNVNPGNHGMDLAARNIQRGRDHGLATFKTFREDVCGLSGPPVWQDGVSTTDDLDPLYGPGQGYTKMEIFPGGLLEKQDPGTDALVGPTFSCLLKQQFQSLKDGDRFFFTHQTSHCHGFSSVQQDHIMQRSLRDIICDNTDVASLQPRVMEKEDLTSNQAVACPTTSTLNVASLLLGPLCCGIIDSTAATIGTVPTGGPTIGPAPIDKFSFMHHERRG